MGGNLYTAFLFKKQIKPVPVLKIFYYCVLFTLIYKKVPLFFS